MVTHDDGSVTLTKKEYEELLESHVWLSCLEAAGVDNWEGYDDACNIRDDMLEGRLDD